MEEAQDLLTQQRQLQLLHRIFSEMPHFQAWKKGKEVADLQNFVGQLRTENGVLYQELSRKLHLKKAVLANLVETYLNAEFPDFMEKREVAAQVNPDSFAEPQKSEKKSFRQQVFSPRIPILREENETKRYFSALENSEKVQKIREILEENRIPYQEIYSLDPKTGERDIFSYQVFIFLSLKGRAKAVFISQRSNQKIFILHFQRGYENWNLEKLTRNILANLQSTWKSKTELVKMTVKAGSPVSLQIITFEEVENKLSIVILGKAEKKPERIKSVEDIQKTSESAQAMQITQTFQPTDSISEALPPLLEARLEESQKREKLPPDLEYFLQKVAKFELVKEENLSVLRKWLEEDQAVSVQQLGNMFFHCGVGYYSEKTRSNFSYLFKAAERKRRWSSKVYSIKALVQNENSRQLFLCLQAKNNNWKIVTLPDLYKLFFNSSKIHEGSHVQLFLEKNYLSEVSLRVGGRSAPAKGYNLTKIEEDLKNVRSSLFYIINFLKGKNNKVAETQVDKGLIKIVTEDGEKMIYLTLKYLTYIIHGYEPKAEEIKQILKNLGVHLLLDEEIVHASIPNVIFAKDLWKKIGEEVGLNMSLESLKPKDNQKIVRKFLSLRLRMLRLRNKLRVN